MPEINRLPQSPASASPSPGPAPAPPRLVEVNLLRKYCPYHLVGDDGSVQPNTPVKDVLKTIDPGIVRLHPADATIVLKAKGVALPTEKTFQGIS